MSEIPDTHPRAESLKIRHLLVEGFKKNIVTTSGLIAHGRGEAFDYLIGEKTTEYAKKAIEAAVAQILIAKHPILSINGNVAALVPDKIVEFSKITGAMIEINLFYRSEVRLKAIYEALRQVGAEEILGIDPEYWTEIPEISSWRRVVDKRGIFTADVVFVPLEDGDRTEALRKLGKTVIAVDLNPLSRTSRFANITIVDNIVRVVPLMTSYAKQLKNKSIDELKAILNTFDNDSNLRAILNYINNRLKEFASNRFVLY